MTIAVKFASDDREVKRILGSNFGFRRIAAGNSRVLPLHDLIIDSGANSSFITPFQLR